MVNNDRERPSQKPCDDVYHVKIVTIFDHFYIVKVTASCSSYLGQNHVSHQQVNHVSGDVQQSDFVLTIPSFLILQMSDSQGGRSDLNNI